MESEWEREKERIKIGDRQKTKTKQCYKSIRPMLPFSGCMLRIDNNATKVYQRYVTNQPTNQKKNMPHSFDYHENVFDLPFGISSKIRRSIFWFDCMCFFLLFFQINFCSLFLIDVLTSRYVSISMHMLLWENIPIVFRLKLNRSFSS